MPEISLTPQLLHMFEGLFENIAVIHSRVSDAKRASIWRSIQAGEIQLVIGSRSAVFSPFKDLGIIVMDEEHEWTYKQDQSPRYHCRDVAKKITELTGAQLVLGSATPSIESMHEAKEGKARLFSLKNRVSGTPLPEVKVVDMKEELRSENYSIFSNQLEQEISSNLEAGKQTILFLNRRGSASSTLCRDCGLVLECEHCDTKLTYHARSRSPRPLVCHYCGRLYPLPSQCPNCQSVRIKHLGVGTQRVEAELKDRFPLARIARADRDTMSKKGSFKELHKAMSNHEVDILIGTQMIAKGWDLSKVSLIGVILADLGLHLPDFRAPERSFQLLTQVAGRAGRREEQGRVIIQSYTPEHPAIEYAKHHDYSGFYEQEIYTRKTHHFPPFSQLIKLIHVSNDKIAAFRAGESMKLALVNADLNLNGDQKHSIDVAPALIPRINGRYYWHAYVQGNEPKSLLNSVDPELLKEWRIDVDPVHTV